jgi:hypothetical protein
MVLQTDNLLPFLQQQFGQQPRTTQKPSTLSGADELPMPGLEGPTSDKAPLLPRARSSDSKEEKNDENPRPSKHKTKAIKGEWQFKMYTDVLHAQSSFARDELVAVARAEMQEGRREAAASRRQERLQARESRAARGQRALGDTDGTGVDEDIGELSDEAMVSAAAKRVEAAGGGSLLPRVLCVCILTGSAVLCCRAC